MIKFTLWSHKQLHWHNCSIGRLWYTDGVERRKAGCWVVILSVGTISLHNSNLTLNHRLSINFTFWSLMLGPSQTVPVVRRTCLLMSDLCNTRSSNGNKSIKIKYEHVIAFLSRLASYELQCLDQALSWFYTSSRKTDDSNPNIKSSGVNPLSTPCFVRILFFK